MQWMKTTSTIVFKALFAAGALLLLSGCDFFRVLAGRPTGDELGELSAKREAALERLEAERLARQADSVRRAGLAEAWVSDSVCVREAMESGRAVFKRISDLKVRPSEVPDCRFCLMMGYFNNRANAERLFARISSDGHSPMFVPFESGATGVALFPSSSAAEILGKIDEVRGKDYFPPDFWIVWNTQKYN